MSPEGNPLLELKIQQVKWIFGTRVAGMTLTEKQINRQDYRVWRCKDDPSEQH